MKSTDRNVIDATLGRNQQIAVRKVGEAIR
jgi:hypothetical protein